MATAKRATGTMPRSSSTRCVVANVLRRSDATAHGATCEITYTRGYDAVVNDPETTEIVATAARRALGDEAVYEGELILGGEDFSAFQACAPGTFLLLGATDPEVTEIHDHHHPQFDIDERALSNGVKVISESVVALLAEVKA